MNDLISRREVTAILDKYRVPDSVYHEINKLHEFSADREKGEWISVSEGLPEKEKERYLIDYEHEGEEYITVSYYDQYGFWSSSEVKAWQPLPEPYKGE